MEAYKKTSEIIDSVRIFHIKMREFYEQLNKQTDNERIKMFLEFLISHEKNHEVTLAEFVKQLSSTVLNSWFKFVPEKLLDDCFKKVELNKKMTLDDVVQYALGMNNCLMEMYKGLIDETNVDEVKQVFISLLRHVEKEEKNLVRDSELLTDL